MKTVGDIKKELSIYPDDWEISFGHHLKFLRLKARGEKLVDVEFEQLIFQNPDGSLTVEPVSRDEGP